MIIYMLSVENPNNVPVYPPSILESSYVDSLATNVRQYGFLTENVGQFCIFPDEATLNTWLSTNRLTDASLVADLNTWKAANDITFTTRVFNATSTDVSVTPIY